MVSTSERKRENKNARTTILWALVDLSTAVKDTVAQSTSEFEKNAEKASKRILICCLIRIEMDA